MDTVQITAEALDLYQTAYSLALSARRSDPDYALRTRLFEAACSITPLFVPRYGKHDGSAPEILAAARSEIDQVRELIGPQAEELDVVQLIRTGLRRTLMSGANSRRMADQSVVINQQVASFERVVDAYKRGEASAADLKAETDKATALSKKHGDDDMKARRELWFD
jgi:hypothetical protein